MSIREEVQKMIEAERGGLTQRDALIAAREERKKAILSLMRKVIEQILSAAPEFSHLSDSPPLGDMLIKIGRGLASARKAEVSWTVDVDFERAPPDYADGGAYFTLNEERYYEFSGFQESESSSSKKKFKNEAELAEYLSREFASTVASARHIEYLREEMRQKKEPPEPAPTSVTSPAAQEPSQP